MIRKSLPGETRTPIQLREHYEIEKELADRLRQSSKEERSHLYAALYDELFRRVPHLTQHASPARRQADVAIQMRLLRPFLDETTVFLEIGPGDCSLSFAAAESVRSVYAVDVSAEVTKKYPVQPGNFNLILSDGSSIPLPPESVDVAFSNQMVEHLHPDDLPDHLRSVWEALKPGGVYLCVTPNRLNGPHDISRYFDTVAAGFHLKEYTFHELRFLFQEAGFSKMEAYVGGAGRYFRSPMPPIIWLEKFLALLPERIRMPLAWNPLGRGLLGIRIAGRKSLRRASL